MTAKKQEELKKDVDGFLQGGEMDYPHFALLVTENGRLASELEEMRRQIETRDAIINGLIPRGVAVRCGRCKNRFYSRNLFGWLSDQLTCPFCNVRVNSDTFRLFPKEVDVSREELVTMVLYYMRADHAWHEARGERNEELSRHFDNLQGRLMDMGFKL